MVVDMPPRALSPTKMPGSRSARHRTHCTCVSWKDGLGVGLYKQSIAKTLTLPRSNSSCHTSHRRYEALRSGGGQMNDTMRQTAGAKHGMQSVIT